GGSRDCQPVPRRGPATSHRGRRGRCVRPDDAAWRDVYGPPATAGRPRAAARRGRDALRGGVKPGPGIPVEAWLDARAVLFRRMRSVHARLVAAALTDARA